jgi:TPR repeat protein
MATRFFGAGQPQPSSDPDASSRPSPGGPETISLAPPEAQATAPEHRLALLVGNARYAQGTLANPVNDVRLVGNVLRALGFAVTIVEDVDKAGLQAAVVAFCVQLEKAGPGAVALFYFAGHGIQHQGSNFLLPVGADIPSTRYLPALAVPADEILVELTRARRKANVIILDACRNNALPGLEGESRDIMQGLAALKLPPDGVLVAYSTAAGAVAEDGDGRHSPYAEALAQALPSLLEPGKRLHDVFIEAAERVKEVTGARQAPALYLQGTLPPLSVDDADRERFRTFVFYEPSWPWRRILKHAAIGLTLVAAASLAVAWFTAYPEMRGLWLHQAGIARSDAYDFACAAPWDRTDRYGLTRTDWCARPIAEIVKKVKQAGLWDSLVGPGVAASDPKAMALEAGALSQIRQARYAAERERPMALALRAGRVGLPAAWDLLNSELTGLQLGGAVVTESHALLEAEVKKRLRNAALAGVSRAELALGWEAVREKDAARAETWIAKADMTDPFGHAATRLGLAYAQRSYPDSLPLDLDKARQWLLVASAKGNRLAYQILLALAADKVIALPDPDRRALGDKIIALGGPLAALVLGRRLLEPGPERNVAEAAKQLAIAAEADDPGAMETLASLYSDGAVSGRPEPAEAMRWLERAAATGDAMQKYRLGLAYTYGLPDREGRPLRPIEPDKAKAVLLQADESKIFHEITLALGAQYEKGTFGKRDLAAARAQYHHVAEAGGSFGDVQTAHNGLQRLDTENKIEATRRLPEISRGDPAAILNAIIYMPILCPGCRADYVKLVDPRLTMLVKAGIARIQFRDWYPREQVDAAADASLMIRCAPPDDRMDLVERFMAGAEQWAGASDRGERLERLKRLAAPTEIAPDGLAACLANESWREGLRQQSADLTRVFGVNQVPMIILNGQVVVRPMQEQLTPVILAVLPPQIVVRLTGRSKLF